LVASLGASRLSLSKVPGSYLLRTDGRHDLRSALTAARRKIAVQVLNVPSRMRMLTAAKSHEMPSRTRCSRCPPGASRPLVCANRRPPAARSVSQEGA
jgi:hypothetical protein